MQKSLYVPARCCISHVSSWKREHYSTDKAVAVVCDGRVRIAIGRVFHEALWDPDSGVWPLRSLVSENSSSSPYGERSEWRIWMGWPVPSRKQICRECGQGPAGEENFPTRIKGSRQLSEIPELSVHMCNQQLHCVMSGILIKPKLISFFYFWRFRTQRDGPGTCELVVCCILVCCFRIVFNGITKIKTHTSSS